MSVSSLLPDVTYVLLSYKQERFIEKAVLSALSQDYPNLNIIISDDNSQDNTFRLAQRLVNAYSGKHVVRCRKNDSNLGLTEHLNLLMTEVKSELVVVAAGDDISLSNRVSRIVEAYLGTDKPMLLSSTAYRIDEEGKRLDGIAPKLVIPIDDMNAVVSSLDSLDDRVGLYLGASGAWRMDLWNKYGPIQYKHCWEDVVMGFRSALEGSYYHIDEPLLEYRVGVGLSTSQPSSIKEKILSRQAKAFLKRDLANQRLQDVRSAKAPVGVEEVINDQVRKYTILASIYTSLDAYISCVKSYPLESLHELGKEFYFYLRSVFMIFARRI